MAWRPHSERNVKHGAGRRTGRTPEYAAWAHMLERCRNPKHKNYDRYGGRGIRVCHRWLQFANFLADMGPRPEGRLESGKALYTLERLDNDGHYDPDNCVWATVYDQIKNRTPRRTKKQMYASRGGK